MFRCIVAMLLGSVAVMNSSQYFPEFVKAKTAAGLMFSMIYRKPKTGDASLGEQIVSSFFWLKKYKNGFRISEEISSSTMSSSPIPRGHGNRL